MWNRTTCCTREIPSARGSGAYQDRGPATPGYAHDLGRCKLAQPETPVLGPLTEYREPADHRSDSSPEGGSVGRESGVMSQPACPELGHPSTCSIDFVQSSHKYD